MVEPRFHGRHALHGSARHKLGDSLLGPLMQQFDLPLLLRDQLVDAGGLAVEEGGDGLLGGEVYNRKLEILDRIVRDAPESSGPGHAGDPSGPKCFG